MPTKPAARIQTLRTELEHHNRRYYIDAEPEISDREFDTLLKELQKLEEKHPELATPDSPTQRVGGAAIDQFQNVKHRVPMLSIDNTYNADELRDYDKSIRKLLGDDDITYVVELKIDGVAISLTYESGLFTRGVTRGDGDRGDDVTHNLRTMPDVPLKLKSDNPPALLEVRGEVFMSRPELIRINRLREERNEKPYENCRNLTAGTLKLLDPKVSSQRRLCMFTYGLGAIEGFDVDSHSTSLKELQHLGFNINPNIQSFDSIDGVIDYCLSWNEKRHDLHYDTDGMVIKVDSFSQRERLGLTSKSPRWVRAYKFAAEQAITKLGQVEFSLGKFGELTPVAIFEPPVRLAGTTVSRASMHNASWVEKMDVRIGDSVVVEKAGEIIPQVVGVETEGRTGDEIPIKWPETCPVCGGPVEKEESASSYNYICANTGTCPAQLTKRVIGFGRRERMDIDGLGEEVAKQLVDSELVTTISDLYRLTDKQLLSLDGFAKQKAKKLLQGIEASKDRGLARLLAALSIYMVGESMAELLTSQFPDIDSLMSASEEELAMVKGFGPKRAASVHAYLDSPLGSQLLADFKELGLKLSQDVVAAPAGGAPLSGKTFVVTGTLSKYGRSEIEKLIKQHGGKPVGSVSKNTDYLVAGEKAGSKLTKAQELGVTILTEDEFEQLI